MFVYVCNLAKYVHYTIMIPMEFQFNSFIVIVAMAKSSRFLNYMKERGGFQSLFEKSAEKGAEISVDIRQRSNDKVRDFLGV